MQAEPDLRRLFQPGFTVEIGRATAVKIGSRGKYELIKFDNPDSHASHCFLPLSPILQLELLRGRAGITPILKTRSAS
jgi:hypothetical protein